MKNRALHSQLLRLVRDLGASAVLRGPVPLLWRDHGLLVDMAGAAARETAHSPGIRAPRIVDYQRLPSQQAFHDLSSTFKGFSGPIGSGKSKALVQEAIRCAYRNPGVEGLIGAPTYRLLRDSTTLELIDTLEVQHIPYKYFQSENRIHLTEPDSNILLRSLDNPERLRAMNLGWFGVDELTYCKEKSWERLEGRLRHPKALYKCGFAVWTPRGKDWVYRRFISARRIAIYESVRAAPSENKVVLAATPNYYKNLEQSYDEKLYRQEVLGEYLDMHSGAVYHAFSDRNVRPCNFDPALPLIVALDFNVDPAAGALLQCETAAGRKTVKVIAEIVLPDSNTPAWMKEFLRRTGPWSEALRANGQLLKVNFYGDVNGGSRNASSEDSSWTIVKRRMGVQEDYQAFYRYPRKNPEVKDRVNAVNTMLCTFGDKNTVAGELRLFIDPRCHRLIEDLEDVIWKVDGNGNTYPEIDKRNPKLTHISDALGYYIAEEHGIRPRYGAVRDTF